MAKISIIIPCFNNEKTISRTLNSVFLQTFQDFNVYIIDDGSTDKSKDVINKFRDPRLFFLQQENAGPGSARNLGIKNSH
jgi:glycosyltransferase involved in cell wall biosynthesis